MVLFLYTSADCVNYFAESTGQILSPNFQTAYSNNLDCDSYITVPSGKQIVMTFWAFNTEAGADWVTVCTCIKVFNRSIW